MTLRQGNGEGHEVRSIEVRSDKVAQMEVEEAKPKQCVETDRIHAPLILKPPPYAERV